MTNPTSKNDKKKDLRWRAEKKILDEECHIPAMNRMPDDIKQIVHDLHVHQVELTIQNEDLRHTQEKLEEARTKYFHLYDLAPVGYMTLSEKGLIQEANLTSASLLDVPRSSLIKAPFSRFILPDDQDIYYRHRKQLFKTGEPQMCELRMTRPGKGWFWARIDASLGHDEDKSPACRAVISDITERVRLEEERAHLQAQLFQTHKMESVGRLAGGVAHDFNNMLMVILGNTELALEGTDSSTPTYAYLEAIHDSAQRSANLTHQLLAFARKQAICPRTVNLNGLVSGLLSMIQRLIGENIELLFHPGENLWPVHMDPSQIDQILVNLAANARDAISGNGRLTIHTRNKTVADTGVPPQDDILPGDYVLIEVRDSGKGMGQDTLSHLFEPFYTTKSQGEGTGLGLATIYGIVKQNNGFITVSSQMNQGACFFIYLPRTLAPTKIKPVEIQEKPERGNETILLVEDEKTILNLCKTILNRYGYTVLDARSPKEAIALTKEHADTIHLLITDVIMPEMNGRDLFEQIASMRPGIKTLFMSGYTDDIIADHGVLEDDIQFLQKPFPTKTLAAKVREILDMPEKRLST